MRALLLLIISILLIVAGCTGPQMTSLDYRFDDQNIRSYAFLICLSSAYEHGYRPQAASDMRQQAQELFSQSHQRADIFALIHVESHNLGQRVPLNLAGEMCTRWRDSKSLDRLLGIHY